MRRLLQHPSAGYVLALLGSLLFSTKAILVKLAFAGAKVDALSLLTVRMLFALPFYLVGAWLIDRDAANVRMSRNQWVLVIVLGLFGYYLSSLFDFMGLQYISAGLERLILFLYPTFSLLINAFVFKQTLSRKQIIAVVLTYAGILVAYIGELQLDNSNPNFVLGSLLVFLCAITYSIYISGSGRIIPQVGANKFNSFAMLAATGGIFLHFLFRGNYSILTASTTLWTYGPALAILSTVIPSYLIAAGMKKIGSSNVAIVSSIGPVSTILQAHLFLGEQIFLEQIVGTCLVLAGVLMLGVKK
ncbi:EamA domain-containing membrane protein RarD [Cnuella takakiae]|uniref:EamA domain-containing membrane protein RarD n=1 Tax=Cnuella takakiae TaxID=1302690 RepID=A0A1M4YDX5_9BACT|nr:DMT family transporter [Cnuella takakiae]OLY93117.1 EamA family transporter [Cnuella takakiae]SHF03672.1 EamA domain-containing membrane protein RarD [Cnuella takakiae]